MADRGLNAFSRASGKPVSGFGMGNSAVAEFHRDDGEPLAFVASDGLAVATHHGAIGCRAIKRRRSPTRRSAGDPDDGNMAWRSAFPALSQSADDAPC